MELQGMGSRAKGQCRLFVRWSNLYLVHSCSYCVEHLQ